MNILKIIYLHQGYDFVVANKEIIEETEEYLFGIVSLVGEVGGALGLFLGFSFMTLWDIGAPTIVRLYKMLAK